MLITTLHETIFEYDAPIRATFTEARLCPVSDAAQTCREFTLSVDPMRPLTQCVDYFGNTVFTFNILPEHGRVVVTGRSVVETHREPFAARPVCAWEESTARHDFLSFGGAVEELPAAAHLAAEAGLTAARHDAPWFEPDSIFAAAQKLGALIHERFTYSKDATHVHTRISEVFAGGSGVCQDFAHIFIAACRTAGVPCRYVSGYLVTRRARAGQGATASHAWVEALIPDLGWCALDPTNNLLANNLYIKLAAGRDYGDVTPTRGVYKGRGVGSRLHVRVHTILEEEPDTRAASEQGQTEAVRELVG